MTRTEENRASSSLQVAREAVVEDGGGATTVQDGSERSVEVVANESGNTRHITATLSKGGEGNGVRKGDEFDGARKG
jgi:Ethanolamine utilization protein EutJ (predicted chaperonin)